MAARFHQCFAGSYIFSSPRHRVKLKWKLGHAQRLLHNATASEKYDLVVIGGGSGGLACAKEAAGFNKRVAVLDFVRPSPKGSTWGLGGTCVNVGCIPKKLMHQAALLGQAVRDARHYGWEVPEQINHSWETLVQAVQNHVKSLNWGHRVQLNGKGVDYYNGWGSFTDDHTVEVAFKSKEKKILQAENIVLATGMRPVYPAEVTGSSQYGISSDDIFSLQKPPGKTLVVGGSYVALETAGFLQGLGFPTTLMVRSICLRGFDQDDSSDHDKARQVCRPEYLNVCSDPSPSTWNKQMSQLVTKHLSSDVGINILWEAVPVSITEGSDSALSVRWQQKDTQVETEEEFDTVLFATGRSPETNGFGIENTGVKLAPNGKILGSNEQTSVGHIYAIGDILQGGVELTPVAIKAGKMLAHRLFGGSNKVIDYNKIPTTVFTPLEYSCVGYSEEAAIQEYTEENLEVYHAFYKPLEFTVAERPSDQCYIKAVCERHGKLQILGLHITGPNAGEMMQGFAVAFGSGLTFDQLSSSFGIHPTSAEEVTKLHITKRSGDDPTVTGC